MNFNLIDIENWDRKEYYEHYLKAVRCTYSITSNIDITDLFVKLKNINLKLYPALIYMAAKVVNGHEEFRTCLDENDNLGYWESMNPCFTIFHRDNKMFTNIWTIFSEDYRTFYTNYNDDINKYGSIKKFDAKGNEPKNTFNVSCIPWTSFTGFNLNLYTEGNYLLPIITYGKYFKQDERIILPLSLQMHHAVCDGYHASIFFNEIQVLVQNCDKWLPSM